MKYLKGMLICLLAVCSLLSFAACGDSADMPENLTEVPVADLSTLITADEVYTATGFRVGEPVAYADGGVNYYSADGSCSVYIGRQEMSVEEFDTLTATSADGEMAWTAAPALGDKAAWCEDALELLVYADGYALDVLVEYGTSRPNDSLIAARHLAALLLEAL